MESLAGVGMHMPLSGVLGPRSEHHLPLQRPFLVIGRESGGQLGLLAKHAPSFDGRFSNKGGGGGPYNWSVFFGLPCEHYASKHSFPFFSCAQMFRKAGTCSWLLSSSFQRPSACISCSVCRIFRVGRFNMPQLSFK